MACWRRLGHVRRRHDGRRDDARLLHRPDRSTDSRVERNRYRRADQHPFLHEEIALLSERLANERPCLGVCLGAQLIADVLGGPVTRNAHSEVGWFDVILNTAARKHGLAITHVVQTHIHEDFVSGATALVPPDTTSAPFTRSWYPVCGSALAARCRRQT